MLHYHAVANNNARLLALTSLTRDEFTALVPAFETAFLARMRDYTMDGLPRLNRRYTPYTNSPLPTTEDKLLFILVHIKQQLTQEVHGQLFGMIQSDTNTWLQVLRPVLLAAVDTLDTVPSRLVPIVEADNAPPHEGPFFYHDGTERAVQRPMSVDEQQEYWSGKTKQHTVKNILLIDAQCTIRWLSATYAGKWHDKTLVEDQVYALPAGSVVVQDRGVQGFMVPGMVMRQPTKKPRGGALTQRSGRRMGRLRVSGCVSSPRSAA
jgi:hypothetical protein